MITYVTEIITDSQGRSTEIIGVSSEWNTAVKRLMEHYPNHTEYTEKVKLTSDLWQIKIHGEYGGYITKMELDKRLS